MTAHLWDHHRKLLHDRGVSDDVIAARGYSSTAKAEWLTGEGFGQAVGRLGAGLVIPVFGAAGYQRFYQFRPDAPRMRDGRPAKYEMPFRQRLAVDVPPGIARELASPRRPLWVTESPIKADSGVSAGLVCVGTFGAMGWRGRNQFGGRTLLADWRAIAWEGREVFIADDSDMATNDDVKRAASELGAVFARWGADVRWVYIPPLHDGGKQGLDDFLARNGRDIHGLLTYADDRPPEARLNGRGRGDTNVSGSPPEKPLPDVPAQTIAQVEAVYGRWLRDGDTVTTRAVLAVYVANMELSGDPVWVFLVGGSGAGKTERLIPLAVMPHAELTSTLSGEAALLSATARRDRAEHAHGGLLRKIGGKGILVLKDFTSILEMDRTDRGKVLAALREVYDGRWDRDVGSEGGQTLTWRGKCGVLAGCTSAIDKAHGVMNEMGPRSLFIRLPPADPDAIGRSALAHIGRETEMRGQLAEATAGLLTHLTGAPHDIGPVEDGLVALAALVALARSPVHRDWSGEVELVGDAEAPTRIIKQLGQLWRACGVLGLGRRESWEVVTRCAMDSVPKLRGKVIACLAGQPGAVDTTTVRLAVSHPKKTVTRALEDLAAHGVVIRKSAGQGHPDTWELQDRTRLWLKAAEGGPEMLVSPPCTVCGQPLNPAPARRGDTVHPNCTPQEDS